jgi:glycosyltransferase involved in cell wall biosynthesis
MKEPTITVLMPVFNGEKYLSPAIDSILDQSYTDFELLIIDDGSTDSSAAICREYRDPRIRLVANERNLGLIATLNRGLDLARGKYIARMDCDDISLPGRFERQFRFMEQNADIGVCGAWFEKIFHGGSETVRTPAEDNLIRFFLVFDNAFNHSTVFLRRSVLEEHGLRYDPAYQYAEDYEFWVRCSCYTRLANIPEVLVHYRFHPENTCHRYSVEQNATADRIRYLQLEQLGLIPDDEELKIHCALLKFGFSGNYDRLKRAGVWLTGLAATASAKWGVSQRIIHRELGRYWYAACGSIAHQGWRIWSLFLSFPVGRMAALEWQWKLLLRCLMRSSI